MNSRLILVGLLLSLANSTHAQCRLPLGGAGVGNSVNTSSWNLSNLRDKIVVVEPWSGKRVDQVWLRTANKPSLVKVGGGSGGTKHEFALGNAYLIGIRIWAGKAVNKIQFLLSDSRQSPVYGGEGGYPVELRPGWIPNLWAHRSLGRLQPATGRTHAHRGVCEPDSAGSANRPGRFSYLKLRYASLEPGSSCDAVPSLALLRPTVVGPQVGRPQLAVCRFRPPLGYADLLPSPLRQLCRGHPVRCARSDNGSADLPIHQNRLLVHLDRVEWGGCQWHAPIHAPGGTARSCPDLGARDTPTLCVASSAQPMPLPRLADDPSSGRLEGSARRPTRRPRTKECHRTDGAGNRRSERFGADG